VVRTVDNKIAELAHILRTVPGSSIVYVRSRQQTKEIAQALQKTGIVADFFHAGLSHEVKILKQNRWKSGDCRVIVSTNAFGMGIDKADVRTVVHMDLPNSPEEYFQEAGRAGRDGERSYAVILYTKSDSAKLRKRITDAFPTRDFIVRVYEALGNYYQVAVGAGFGNAYDFSLHEFCIPFRFPFLQAHHALKILELAGYIEYTEEIDLRSRVRFLIYRDEMYSLQLDREMDELLHTLLRNYTGLFSDDVYIDESLLAARTGKSRKEVCEMLIALSRMRYIRYIPQKRTPFVVFTTSREDTQFVSIPRTVYEERKKRFEKRINAMIEYVEQREVCRSRMLLIYFGESDSKDCGQCDVCRRKNESGVTNYLYRMLRDKILAVLKTEPSRRLNSLVELVADRDGSPEQVIRVIRFMVDAGELSLKDDRISLAPEA
jgi:ATP-dependent DNA helicase RecQ